MGYQTVKSVTKALAILDLLTDRPLETEVMTLAEISQATGLLPATARNLLRTLEQSGYVAQAGHGRYKEGEKCLKLFRCEGVLRKLKEVATPIIERTSQELGESVLLATLIKGRRQELLRCQAPDDHMVEPQWYANAEFYRMYTTRTILAWLSPEQLTEFLEINGLPSSESWPECGNTPEGLKRELAKIRHAGGCMESRDGLFAIAVPILTNGANPVASLGCYAPLARTDKPRATGILRMLHDCSLEIQDALGTLS